MGGSGSLWVAMARYGWLWLAMGGDGSLWVAMARSGSFQCLVPPKKNTLNNCFKILEM